MKKVLFIISTKLHLYNLLAGWQLCEHLQMKYYGWIHGTDKNRTHYIIKEINGHVERWTEEDVISQCENVNDMYILDYDTFTFIASAKLCESVGLQIINEFDFAKFPGTDMNFKIC